jgi:hypothetical protein
MAQPEAPLRVEQTDIPTNLGLAHALCASTAAKVVDALSGHMTQPCLRLRAAGEHAGNPLLASAMAEACRRQGLSIATEDSDCTAALEYRILELQIAYTGLDRSALLVKQDIERHGACVVYASLLDDRSGRELATTQQEALLADRFPKDLQALVASDSYPFTAPELKTREWSKSVEPFVVTGLVAGLIYLFFSNQSSN